MDFGFSGEIIVLALLGLILFGPRKLPEMARKAGRFVDDLKRAKSEFQEQLNREVGSLESEDAKKSDPSKNLLSSLIDDFKALHSEMEPVKAVMNLAEPPQLTQQRNQLPLMDNINRIKDLLATNEAANGTLDQEHPSHPAEAEASETSRSSAIAERAFAEAAPLPATSESAMPQAVTSAAEAESRANSTQT